VYNVHAIKKQVWQCNAWPYPGDLQPLSRRILGKVSPRRILLDKLPRDGTQGNESRDSRRIRARLRLAQAHRARPARNATYRRCKGEIDRLRLAVQPPAPGVDTAAWKDTGMTDSTTISAYEFYLSELALLRQLANQRDFTLEGNAAFQRQYHRVKAAYDKAVEPIVKYSRSGNKDWGYARNGGYVCKTITAAPVIQTIETINWKDWEKIMPENRTIVTITAPLPGWIRFQHVRTGRTLDFNPAYYEHRQVLPYYVNNADWQDITDQYKDEYVDKDENKSW
jgi:hypothetical protein